MFEFEADFVLHESGIHGKIVLTAHPQYSSNDIESQEQGQRIVRLMRCQGAVSAETVIKLLRQMEVLPHSQKTVEIGWELLDELRRVRVSPSDRARSGIMYFGKPAQPRAC